MDDRLRDTHFTRLRQIMESHTGIQLPSSKRTMIEGRLRKRVRVLGLPCLETYGSMLFDEDLLRSEFDLLVDAMTTNKTDFFREPDHFDFLRDQAMPDLLADPARRGIDFKIWSAAASTGAEAFTIAMVLAVMQDAGTRLRFSILGTDICKSIVEQARRAVYPSAMLDAVPPDLRRRYVMESADPDRDESRMVPELRRLVRFEHLNLMDPTYPFDRDVDVIFCRNVLIYFSRDDQQKVLARLVSHLRPGGYLILGHSESFVLGDKSFMTQILPTVFKRTTEKRTLGRVA